MTHATDTPVVEYIYSAHSAFAYLGSATLNRLCAKHNATLVHKLVVLNPVIEAQRSTPFRARTQAHADYYFGREIERWAEYRNVPIINFRPTHHDADYRIASGMIISLGATGADTNSMAHRILEAHWRDDADISNPETLAAITSELGHDPDLLLKQAASHQAQSQLQANTDWAIENHVFGSPTYIVNGDPFYGQDRLELVERALTQPFSPTTWTRTAVE